MDMAREARAGTVGRVFRAALRLGQRTTHCGTSHSGFRGSRVLCESRYSPSTSGKGVRGGPLRI